VLLFCDRRKDTDAPISELKNGFTHVTLLVPNFDPVQALNPHLSHLVGDGVVSLSRKETKPKEVGSFGLRGSVCAGLT
jgi:hypothetical protein